MQKELELVKFTLTPSMTMELIKFNKLKKELLEIKELYNLDKNEDLLKKIEQIQNELDESRDRFIKDFRLNNKSQIEEYLKIKDQFWSFFYLKKEIEKFCGIIHVEEN